MKKTIIPAIIALSLLSACVPAKKFNDLEEQFNTLKDEKIRLANQLEEYQQNEKEVNSAYQRLEDEKQAQQDRLNEMQKQLEHFENQYSQLQSSYDALEQNSSSALAENSKQNRKLLEELEEKQAMLAEEKGELDKLRRNLEERSNYIKELERTIQAKDAKMQALKNSVSAALTNFEGKGLSVEQKNGKVYVSMENKLLFSSGSWAVGEQGKQAVKQLGLVLAENPDINVLIEGHTDDVPYGGSGALQNNWDLSTKRATAIVNILVQNHSINPERLTAAGRSEFAPVASNKTEEGRAKNRRIEVILTPKLDEVTSLINRM